MAKKARKKAKRQTQWHLGGKKASLSRKRGHKPLALLKLYHSKMERNLGRLEGVIHRRQLAGE